jgi:hypothetical protein
VIDIETATAAEIVEEARRRADRRAQGKPLAPDPVEVAERVREDDERLEKEIQRDVWRLYRKHGCQVWWMSQPRATKQTPGPGDLIVFHARTGNAWWHETKTSTGEQEPAQKVFEEYCLTCDWQYVLGGIAAAENQLIKIGVAERIDGSLDPIITHNRG